MRNEFRLLDLDALKTMYLAEMDILKKIVINGSSWDVIRDQRHRLIDMEVAIFQKMKYKDIKTA